MGIGDNGWIGRWNCFMGTRDTGWSRAMGLIYGSVCHWLERGDGIINPGYGLSLVDTL